MSTNKKFYYQIIVWPCDHITGDQHESVGHWSIDEAAEALAEHLEMIAAGFKWSYITVKKQCNVWGDTLEEYGNEMLDCDPLEYLPKYVQRKLGPILTMTYEDFNYDDME